MSPYSWAGLVITVVLILVLVRLYLLDRDVARLQTAVSILARESGNAQQLAAYLLVAVYPKLSSSQSASIPQRVYLWAVALTAQSRAEQAQALPDLTSHVEQLPPELPPMP